ncbi:nucleotidyl transferase AbiEii/AbiGii toxin family protein [Hyphomicrobium sp.]|uniref:nucleotidyl transferase AbiEii/AbiGii toxin family protein n=1 Tax=Hyphomicrobium sp. TaxID=82 RepID=UPI003F72E885
MARERYEEQVRLLVQIIPIVAEETSFALKGGTAINLFYRDMPRLSVDIDLTFLPVKDRAESLKDIDDALERIRGKIEGKLPKTRAQRIAGGGGGETRVLARRGGAEVKIETSPVTRGVVNDPAIRTVTAAVEERFGFAETLVVSFEDLFGGKLHAALDRQHPRDLYDVKLLYENEGLTDALFKTFLVYIASSGRPPHELLKPTLAQLDAPYAAEFEGMTNVAVPLADLIATRARLLADIQVRLDEPARKFLLSLHDAEPEFSLIGLPQAADLPAVKWKLQNLERLKRENPDKHAEQRIALKGVWAA